MGSHIDANGQFQSDKYPTCPPGKVPLSVQDKTAQDLLWEYAQRRRAVDCEFADDLETSLKAAGYSRELDELAEANANLTLWCVHVLGMDDVHAEPSHAAAVASAARLNRATRANMPEGDNSVLLFGYAAPWPHSPESHAEALIHQADQEAKWMAAKAARAAKA